MRRFKRRAKERKGGKKARMRESKEIIETFIEEEVPEKEEISEE